MFASGVDETIMCSPKPDSRIALLKKTPTQLTEHEDVKLLCTQSRFCYYMTASLVQDVSLHTVKEQYKYLASHKAFIYNVFSLQAMQGQWSSTFLKLGPFIALCCGNVHP